MNLKLRRIVGPEFVQSYRVLMSLPLQAKEAYWIAKALRVLDAAAKDFQTARKTVMEKFGFSELTQITEENREKVKQADKEIEELLEQEVEVPLKPIVLPDSTVLTATNLIALEGIVAVSELDEKPA